MHALCAGQLIPLEILPLGEFDPVYRSTLDVQSGELPVLPLSIYGSVRCAVRCTLCMLRSACSLPLGPPQAGGMSCKCCFWDVRASQEERGLCGA